MDDAKPPPPAKPARSPGLSEKTFFPPANMPSASQPYSLKSTLRVNPTLIPVKLLVFLIHGGVSALFPYFTLHMKSVGISYKEIAWILLILPIISSIGPPIGGALADRIGNYKIVLIIFTILSVLFHTLLWFAVPFYSSHTSITNATLSGAYFDVKIPCNGDPMSTALSESQNRNLINCTMRHSWRPSELRNCTSTCRNDPQVCFVGLSNPQERICYTENQLDYVRIEKAQFQERPPKWTPIAFTIPQRNFPRQYNFTRCKTGAVVEVDCGINCVAAGRNEIQCKEKTVSVTGDRLTTISTYFTFRFLSFTAIRVVFPLSDAAVLEIAKKENGDFGIQRLFASVAFSIIPPFSGWMFGIATRNQGFEDYSPAFYIFGILSLMSAFLMLVMQFGKRPPQQNIWMSVGVVMRNPNVAVFVLVIFFHGCAFGVLVHYLLLFVKLDPLFVLKVTPGYLLGLISAAGYLFGIPLLFFSKQIIAKFGHENIVAAGMLCYAIRFVLYSYIYNQFLILPAEIFTGVTGMLLVVGPQFAIKYAPKHLATLVGLFGAVTFGIGGGIGPLVGGLMIDAIGYRQTFRVLALVCAVITVLYLLAYHVGLKRRAAHPQPSGNGHVQMDPVITKDEVQPLAPSIETIVRNGDASSPRRTRKNISSMEIPELEEEPRNYKGLRDNYENPAPMHPALRGSQDRLTPDGQQFVNDIGAVGSENTESKRALALMPGDQERRRSSVF